MQDLAHKVHNCSSDTFRIALTNAANPPVNTNTVKANLTEIAYTNVSGGANPTLTTSSSGQSGGVYTLLFADKTITASGGSIAPFRYVVIYNDTAASDQVVGWFDYGSDLTLLDTETLTIDWTTSTLTIT